MKEGEGIHGATERVVQDDRCLTQGARASLKVHPERPNGRERLSPYMFLSTARVAVGSQEATTSASTRQPKPESGRRGRARHADCALACGPTSFVMLRTELSPYHPVSPSQGPTQSARACGRPAPGGGRGSSVGWGWGTIACRPSRPLAQRACTGQGPNA